MAKAKESFDDKKTRTRTIIAALKKQYPDAKCALNHTNAYELLVATILSAQCTDVRVIMVTPHLFKKYPTPEALAKSAQRYGITVEEYKTRNLMKTEIKSVDIGRMVCAMAGNIFAKTTGAQIPVDGGNDRTI